MRTIERTSQLKRDYKREAKGSHRKTLEGDFIDVITALANDQALIEKGWIKANNFKNSNNKAAYAYLLTPTGIEHKAQITVRFLQRELAEYETLNGDPDQRVRGEAPQVHGCTKKDDTGPFSGLWAHRFPDKLAHSFSLCPHQTEKIWVFTHFCCKK